MPRSPDQPPLAVVAATFEEVRSLAALLQGAGAEHGIDDIAMLDCELALVEAANNIVEHGYAEIADGTIAFWVEMSAGEVRMELLDCGRPIPEGHFSRCQLVELNALDGRGTAIIQSCVDEIGYSSQGGENRLVLIKRL